MARSWAKASRTRLMSASGTGQGTSRVAAPSASCGPRGPSRGPRRGTVRGRGSGRRSSWLLGGEGDGAASPAAEAAAHRGRQGWRRRRLRRRPCRAARAGDQGRRPTHAATTRSASASSASVSSTRPSEASASIPARRGAARRPRRRRARAGTHAREGQVRRRAAPGDTARLDEHDVARAGDERGRSPRLARDEDPRLRRRRRSTGSKRSAVRVVEIAEGVVEHEARRARRQRSDLAAGRASGGAWRRASIAAHEPEARARAASAELPPSAAREARRGHGLADGERVGSAPRAASATRPSSRAAYGRGRAPRVAPALGRTPARAREPGGARITRASPRPRASGCPRRA